MANITSTLKLNDHNFREWGIYFRVKYCHIEGYTRVRIAYEALILVQRLSDVRATETESNQVLKLLALMPWEFCHLVDRLSNLPDSEQTVAKTKIALEAEWKAAVRNGAIKTPRGQANEDRALFVAGGRGAKDAVVTDVAEVAARPEVAKPNEATVPRPRKPATTVVKRALAV
ncbi:hypothetical protein H310_14956 [Aphanomyces invadans]|uniref:Uncharacterized protein n=1 Tax=Aphanomyces invadans TaxID=157072 RepID=A0A024TA29_9STRA|nr:hypothetical protein H310_14956 [Aphanomyces invadans]ETV90212.1 hypothetical protein H310_14956 [Aphanomyces invadans]|eukprot:XP_008881158.1 hypothetical protein H310_14956 [Aphanomyces invadans]